LGKSSGGASMFTTAILFQLILVVA
jgi:hypothetical protein